MIDQQRIDFDKCDKWRTCSASVCPLYHKVEYTYYVPGDKRCTRILDYLEGKEMPEEFKEIITRTEPRWRKALGESLLAKWLKNRKDARGYFRKAI